MGHMTVVTGGIPTMRRVAPGGIIGAHNVAIDTRGGIIAHQISMHSEQVGEQKA